MINLAKMNFSTKLLSAFSFVVALFIRVSTFQIYKIFDLGVVQGSGAQHSKNALTIKSIAIRAKGSYSMITEHFTKNIPNIWTFSATNFSSRHYGKERCGAAFEGCAGNRGYRNSS